MRLPRVAARPGRVIATHPRIAAAVLLCAALLGGGWLWLRDSSLVRVEKVTVVGASGPEAPRVRAALVEAARTMTTLHVQRQGLLAAVREYPTVRDVRVSTHLLHRLTITVVGRPAVATLVSSGERVAVAADGTLLRGAQAPGDVPSLAVGALPAGPRLTDHRAERALALIAAAPAPMRRHVTRVFLGPEGLQADLRGGPAVILGDASRLRAKWIAAARVVGDPGARGARYVDVRLPERAVAGGFSTTGAQPQPSATG